MPEIEDTPSNSFLTTLAALEYGNLVPEASEKLASLVSAVLTSQKKGEITLKLKLETAGREGRQIKITSELAVKEPKAEPGESLFFGTAQGQLLQRDPNQREFEFGKESELPKPVAAAK